MEIDTPFVFQTDSKCVNNAYQNLDNYLIENDTKDNINICAVYFSSNYIYFPNTEANFNKSIVVGNKFEWYNLRHPKARKHIFIRDIKKQWYLHGINSKIDSLELLAKFIEKEIQGFETYFIGSSAGGYAAVLLGSMLNVKRIYSFNNQFYLTDLLKISTSLVDPIIFREQFNSKISKFFNIKSYISNPSSIYYFHSNKSKWDLRQYEEVKDLKMNVISINTKIHGVPLLKNNLEKVFSLTDDELKVFVEKKWNPILLSISIVGLKNTLFFLIKLLPNAYKRWIYNPICSQISKMNVNLVFKP